MAGITLTAKIKVLVTDNPHKSGSKDFSKFQKLISTKADTVALAVEAGIDKGYLAYANKKHIISLEGVPNSESSAEVNPKPVAKTIAEPKIWTSRFKPSVLVFGDQPALLLKEGPDQSEVKFANGNIRIVCNTWLEPLAENGKSRSKPSKK